MGVDLDGIEFFTGPTVLGGPDDLEAVITDFLAAATRSLAIAVQEIDSRPIAEQILAAKARGVRVQVILEGDYLVESPPVADPWMTMGPNEGNRVIHAALLRAGIDVITDLNPSIFHQKFVVRDPGPADRGGAHRFDELHAHRHGQEPAGEPAAVGQQPQPRRRPARRAAGEGVPRRVRPPSVRHLRRAARAARAPTLGVPARRDPRQAALRPAARPGDGDHEADAQGPGRASTSPCSPSPARPGSTTR